MPKKSHSTAPIDEGGVERLFPFLLRARKLLIGRDTLYRSRRLLQCVLITTDIAEESRKQLLQDFRDYPVIQKYTSAELEKFFQVRGAKVVGFAKSSLASSIYRGLKPWRINQPPVKPETRDNSGSENQNV